jgi:hypothetical protein
MPNRVHRWWRVGPEVAALWLALACCPRAGAEEFYYLLVFGSQQAGPCARYAHTFATFVKATGRGPCAQAYRLEAHTISWMPATLEVRPGALLPEPGRNLDLGATLRWALATGQHVSLWGPYRIDRGLYDGARRQIALLESGAVRYKAIDTGRCSCAVSNCIHAVRGSAGGPGLCALSPGFGDTASCCVTHAFRPWIIEPARKHEWVSSRLGLDAYPLIRRDLTDTPIGPVRASFRSLLGREVGGAAR